ncbi:plasmid stabilization protein [Roseateles chitinivorans]|uniref:Plasmid stabilization protein n=1 Tax=Roseateles chitinivorans TaxID=2917965 RepID=A0A2G9CEI1_9BURK|nr:type II toxin-antitoxin system RelE/ParE family toxin [Roseateles chitinivorans]PIM54833.1 plasmid stabilization protein [Roseateles chitinivorans]
MRVHLLPEAEQDLIAIHEYIARHDRRRALAFVLSLRDKIEALSHMPDAHPFIGRGDVRRRLHGRYVILFRLDLARSRVTVQRVLHSAQDLEKLELL